MAELTPLSIDAAHAELEELAGATSELDKMVLLSIHDLLRAATAGVVEAPSDLLRRASDLVAEADGEVIESLAPRARVVMRLLRSGALAAAWVVVIDNATGSVRREFHASTSSGADRTEWALPLLTSVEPPNVYADLPAFRDPRYDLADELFEIGSAVRLRCHVDEVSSARHPGFAGWAAMDHLTTHADELVALVASQGDREVRWPGARIRRADLVGGSRDTLRRRAWAGWFVECHPEDLGEHSGRWALSIEVTHRDLVRRARIGKAAGELAARVVGRQLSDKPATRLLDGPGGWAIGAA